jgi:DNA-binding transcriptional LysR family regulator
VHPGLASLDLNLLVVLEVLLEERNATRAAARLGLTQPGVSTALARLREALGDPLLVRGPRGMAPTPRGLELQKPLREALDGLDRALRRERGFDPATSERTFVVAATDYVQFVLLGGLVRLLQRHAPRVRLRVVPVAAHFPWVELEAGTLDLALGRAPAVPEGLRRKLLFRDRVVFIVRRDHPLKRAAWTLDDYTSVSHIEALPLEGPTMVDTLLGRKKHRRRVVVTVPHFLSAPFVVLETDCAFTLAQRIAVPLARDLPLRVLEVPFDAPDFVVQAHWHERFQSDAAHAWLRRMVAETASALPPLRRP